MRRAKARLLTRPDATTILILWLYLLARNSADKSLNKFRFAASAVSLDRGQVRGDGAVARHPGSQPSISVGVGR